MLHEGTCSEVGLAPSVQGGVWWCSLSLSALCWLLPWAGLSPFVIGNQMRNQHHSTEVSSGLVASDRVHRSLVPPSTWIRRRSVLDSLRLTSVFGRRFDDASRNVARESRGPGATPRTAPRRAPHARGTYGTLAVTRVRAGSHASISPLEAYGETLNCIQYLVNTICSSCWSVGVGASAGARACAASLSSLLLHISLS